jgi:hypothetical protein
MSPPQQVVDEVQKLSLLGSVTSEYVLWVQEFDFLFVGHWEMLPNPGQMMIRGLNFSCEVAKLRSW